MMLIPVIDLRAGRVVRAQRGRREQYQPVVSQLAEGSDPLVIARALLQRAAANRLYVADLDALTGGAPQLELLHGLADALPGVQLWLDAAFADLPDVQALGARLAGRWRPVFGSESLASRAALERCMSLPQAVLSLDRRDGQRLDPAGCWDAPALWPREVIVMTLERVGSDSGPDLDTLAAIGRLAPQARLYGAGGVRDAADLQRARAAGAAGWLVASALHDGRLDAATISPGLAP